MKIKTSELTGAALDWAVAKCEGYEPFTDGISWIIHHAETYQPLPKYSTDWAQGGPIIERDKIDTNTSYPNTWVATCHDGSKTCTGPTPLIAAMRCYVASKMGDEIEVPEELL